MDECPFNGMSRDVFAYFFKALFVEMATLARFDSLLITSNSFWFGALEQCDLRITVNNCRQNLIVVPIVMALLSKKFCEMMRKITMVKRYCLAPQREKKCAHGGPCSNWGFQVPIVLAKANKREIVKTELVK